MSAYASRVLAVAAGEIGYNRWTDPQAGTKYGRWYAELVKDPYFAGSGVPYCAMFVTWVMYHADAGDRLPGIPGAYCPWIVRDARARGRLLPDKTKAQPGDVIFFDWPDQRTGKRDGAADHVGFVEANLGGYVQTIEGNTSKGTAGSQVNGGGVYRRVRYWADVVAVARPYYDNAPTPKTLDEDGVFGEKSTRELQRQCGTPVDGEIWGQEPTWRARLWGVTSITRWDSTGSAVIRVLQRKCGLTGLDADGVLGPTSIKAIQRKLGVDPDGWWGSGTSAALQRALNAGQVAKW